jgi:hypothetical protein
MHLLEPWPLRYMSGAKPEVDDRSFGSDDPRLAYRLVDGPRVNPTDLPLSGPYGAIQVHGVGFHSDGDRAVIAMEAEDLVGRTLNAGQKPFRVVIEGQLDTMSTS